MISFSHIIQDSILDDSALNISAVTPSKDAAPPQRADPRLARKLTTTPAVTDEKEQEVTPVKTTVLPKPDTPSTPKDDVASVSGSGKKIVFSLPQSFKAKRQAIFTSKSASSTESSTATPISPAPKVVEETKPFSTVVDEPSVVPPQDDAVVSSSASVDTTTAQEQQHFIPVVSVTPPPPAVVVPPKPIGK